MDNKKLVITARKYKGDTSVVSVRLPNEMVGAIEKIVDETGRNRNEIITTCLEFALENLQVESDK